MTKEIIIGDKPIQFKASAFTPFMYKAEFGRDITADVRNMNTEEGIDLPILSQLAYIMAKGANADIEPLEEWLEQFNMFDILKAQTDIITLWGLNSKQHSTPRKK